MRRATPSSAERRRAAAVREHDNNNMNVFGHAGLQGMLAGLTSALRLRVSVLTPPLPQGCSSPSAGRRQRLPHLVDQPDGHPAVEHARVQSERKPLLRGILPNTSLLPLSKLRGTAPEWRWAGEYVLCCNVIAFRTQRGDRLNFLDRDSRSGGQKVAPCECGLCHLFHGARQQ